MAKQYKSPAAWAKVLVVGDCRIVPAINASCPDERPSRAWMFYRLYRGDQHISDHGDKAGAITAAKELRNR